MAVRKSVEETLVVDGPRDKWLSRCQSALQKAGFSAVKANSALNQVEGEYHKFLVWGEILVTLMPDGQNTKIVAKATANVDNIWTLFCSPTNKIIGAFKDGLS